MKLIYLLLLVIPCMILAHQHALITEKQRPDNIVDVKKLIPEIQTDIRYFSEHNFVGRRINGYLAPVCLLTIEAAQALKEVLKQLLPMGLTLKVYDCYRPQTAVDDFVHWASEINNTTLRTEFYPQIDKSKLFSEGYIGYRSGHSRGSTLDVTLVPVNSKIPVYDKEMTQVDCTAAQSQRFPDNGLDMGTGYDCFSPVSHPGYPHISAQSRANRLLLQHLMIQAGFNPLDTEWWHFTLGNEPYPYTYFDFTVKN